MKDTGWRHGGTTSMTIDEPHARILAVALRRFAYEVDTEVRFDLWAQALGYKNVDAMGAEIERMLADIGQRFPVTRAETEPR